MKGEPTEEFEENTQSSTRKQRTRKHLKFAYWYLVISMTLAITALRSLDYYQDSNSKASVFESIVEGTIDSVPIYILFSPLILLGIFLYRKSRW